jgi:hypothetical protein
MHVGNLSDWCECCLAATAIAKISDMVSLLAVNPAVVKKASYCNMQGVCCLASLCLQDLFSCRVVQL